MNLCSRVKEIFKKDTILLKKGGDQLLTILKSSIKLK